jgi:ketopantoate reductase
MGSMSFVPSKANLPTYLPTLQMLILDAVVTTPIDVAGHYDYVVCVNKAINLDAVAKSLVPVIDDTTTIVLIQNGVGNEDPFRAQFPNSSILSCVVGLHSLHLRNDHSQLIVIDLGWGDPDVSRNCRAHQVREHRDRPVPKSQC